MVSFFFEGIPRLQQEFTKAYRKLESDSATEVENAARRITMRARMLAPVVTGTLRASIDYTKVGPTLAFVGVAPGPADVYWRFVEFGTVHSPAHPYFIPAAVAERSPFVNAFVNVTRKIEDY